MGVVSSLGNTANEFWDALRRGRSGISPLRAPSSGNLPCRIGAEVLDFDSAKHFDPRAVPLLDRFAQFAIVAARRAISHARLELGPDQRTRAAVVTGTSIGGQTTQDEGFQLLYGEGRTRVHPFTLPKIMPNAAASQISMDQGITGPVYNISSACASSTHAIGQAFWMVRSGVIDVALAGGTEAPFSYGNMKAWEALRALSPDVCRPFSRNRNGTLLAEGAAILILESLDSAVARGATIHGEIVGFGMSADAAHITQPSSDGAAQAMRSALSDARIEPADIQYVNAHGTGTLANDRSESVAIRRVFGSHPHGVCVSSTKSMHGHGQGAAGAIEAVATLCSLRAQLVPPTINFSEPDPECDLDVVPNEARPAELTYALSNSFAFGGLNAVLAFRCHDARMT